MKDISLVRILPVQPKVPFIALRVIAGIISILAIIASIFLFTTKSLNYGIDFTGGTVIEIGSVTQVLEDSKVRTALEEMGVEGFTVQGIQPPEGSETSDGVKIENRLIRIGLQLQDETGEAGEGAQQVALKAVTDGLRERLGDFFVRSTDVVGSQVSGELRRKGILSVGIALFLVLLYIWFRFEWQFGLGAVLALAHDVILTIGVFSLLQIEFNLTIIAAILTIVGYSLNDTVIVYDRIRENMRKYKTKPMKELINLSINDTLSRTIMTSLTTLLALVALYILGGEGLRGFSFAMIWGVFVGTYSSIFVASPLLLLFKLRNVRSSEMEAAATA